MMKKINIGLKKLQQRYHALITALVPKKMWEISIPELERTTYAQTGLILTRGAKFSTLTDNGTTNNGKAFDHPGEITRQLHVQMVKYNVDLKGNEYYTCQVVGDDPEMLLRRVKDMVSFLTALDRIMKQHV